jgi:hypothetical protein
MLHTHTNADGVDYFTKRCIAMATYRGIAKGLNVAVE